MDKSKAAAVYLSNSRPDFTPFEIDCGRIPAYRFRGNLRTVLEANAIDAATAIHLLEDMLMVREMEEMIVKLRSGAYEPIAGSTIVVPRTSRLARKRLRWARRARWTLRIT